MKPIWTKPDVNLRYKDENVLSNSSGLQSMTEYRREQPSGSDRKKDVNSIASNRGRKQHLYNFKLLSRRSLGADISGQGERRQKFNVEIFTHSRPCRSLSDNFCAWNPGNRWSGHETEVGRSFTDSAVASAASDLDGAVAFGRYDFWRLFCAVAAAAAAAASASGIASADSWSGRDANAGEQHNAGGNSGDGASLGIFACSHNAGRRVPCAASPLGAGGEGMKKGRRRKEEEREEKRRRKRRM